MSAKSAKPAKPTVLFFPGKGMTLKRYKPYFPSLELVGIVNNLTNPPTCIMCHSRGIDAALDHKSDLSIIALDPSHFSTNPRVVSWTKLARKPEVPPEAQVHYYSVNTHYPYMFKTLRDQILKSLF